MSERNRYLNFLASLRRVPVIYAALRGIRKIVLVYPRKLFIELLRWLPAFIPFRPPRGFFSLLKKVQSGEVEGRIESLGQSAPDDAFPLCELSGMKEGIFRKYPAFWARVENANLIGKGLTLVDQHKQICLEAAYGERFYKNDSGYSTVAKSTSARLSGNWTSIVSHWNPSDQPTNYAHYLMESLPRLRWMDEFPENTGIIAPSVMRKYHIEPLEILGLADRIRPTSETSLIVENCYLAPPQSMILAYNPAAIAWLRSQFLPHGRMPEGVGEKIYIPRFGQTRMAANEEELIQAFKELGWSIVDTAKISFREQVGLFQQARVICGMHGAAFSNMTWASPGCRIIEMFPSNFLTGCHEWLAREVGASYSYPIFPIDYHMDAIVDLKELRSLLAKLKVL